MDYIREATEDDCAFLAPRLRLADVREIAASSGLTPIDALRTGRRMSEVCFIMLTPSGVPFGIVGVVPDPADRLAGIVWMVATDDLERYRIHFLRNAKQVLHDLNRRWPVLTNAVDARNTVHIDWLRWMGFVFVRRIPAHGVAKIPFIEFVRIEDV